MKHCSELILVRATPLLILIQVPAIRTDLLTFVSHLVHCLRCNNERSFTCDDSDSTPSKVARLNVSCYCGKMSRLVATVLLDYRSNQLSCVKRNRKSVRRMEC